MMQRCITPTPSHRDVTRDMYGTADLEAEKPHKRIEKQTRHHP